MSCRLPLGPIPQHMLDELQSLLDLKASVLTHGVFSSSNCASGFAGPLALSVSFKYADIRESASNGFGKTIRTACNADSNL